MIFFYSHSRDIDVVAGAAAFFFDFGEMGKFTPVWLGLVVPSDGVEAGAFGGAAGDDNVGHADDGRGVHAAAEFGEDGTVGTEAALDGCGEAERKCSSYSASVR